MPLQVRVIHGLGQQVTDLPERPMQQPLIVGRAADADVQIPAVNVSRRHCLLFVNEGRWMLQDGGSSGGTRVNGQAVTNPVYINSGDVVSLGAGEDSAQIVIDPFGQGVIAASGAAPAAAGAAGTAAAAKPYRAASPTAVPGALPQPVGFGAAVPSPAVMPHYSAAPQENFVEGQSTLGEAALRARQNQGKGPVRRPPTLSPGMLALGAALGLLIGGLGLFLLWQRVHHPNVEYIGGGTGASAADKMHPTPGADSGSEAGANAHARGSKIFQDPTLYGPDNPAAPAAPFNVDKGRWGKASTLPGATTPDAENARNVDPDFKHVDDVHVGNVGNPQDQVCIYALYLQSHPRSAFEADVREYINEALDRIWWIKIDKFLQERQELQDHIQKLKEDIAAESDEKFKQKIVAQKTDDEKRLGAVQDHLKEMNYLSKERPNVDDLGQIAELRKARDPDFYDRWKEDERRKIVNSHGQSW